jgi:hypothetical protein
LELFSQSYNCAQSVFAACAANGLSEAQRLALAAPFGGGIARQGESAGRSPERCWLWEKLPEKPWRPIPLLAGMLSTSGHSN